MLSSIYFKVCDKIIHTMGSNRRVFLVETMGGKNTFKEFEIKKIKVIKNNFKRILWLFGK
jgi:hypothetical protein